MMTTGVFGQGNDAVAKGIATALTKQAKGGFEGFHNDATVTSHPSSHGSWTITVTGGCRAFHAHVHDLFRGSCRATYASN